MSTQEPLTYEEMSEEISKITKLGSQIEKYLKKAQEEEKEKKEHEAQEEEEKKKHEGKKGIENDDDYDKKDSRKGKMAKLIAKLQSAMDEEDTEKRKEKVSSILAAMEDEEKKKEHEAQDDDEEKKKEQEAKLASLEKRYKEPIAEKILAAARIINPEGIKQIESELKSASLEEVEALYNNHYKKFEGALGLSAMEKPRPFVPFQMQASMGTPDENEDEIYSASSSRDFAALDTEKLYKRASMPGVN